MDERNDTTELCHAHSGVMTFIKIGAAIISGLMVIFCALLSIMWSEQKDASRSILSKIESLASNRDADLKPIRERVEEIWKEQLRIKWVFEEKERILGPQGQKGDQGPRGPGLFGK